MMEQARKLRSLINKGEHYDALQKDSLVRERSERLV
jgi:hypothetical protein